MVDDEDAERTFAGLELEAELVAESLLERGAGDFGWSVGGGGRGRGRTLLSPFDREVEGPGETGLVHDRAAEIDAAAEGIGHKGQGNVASAEAEGSGDGGFERIDALAERGLVVDDGSGGDGWRL